MAVEQLAGPASTATPDTPIELREVAGDLNTAEATHEAKPKKSLWQTARELKGTLQDRPGLVLGFVAPMARNCARVAEMISAMDAALGTAAAPLTAGETVATAPAGAAAGSVALPLFASGASAILALGPAPAFFQPPTPVFGLEPVATTPDLSVRPTADLLSHRQRQGLIRQAQDESLHTLDFRAAYLAYAPSLEKAECDYLIRWAQDAGLVDANGENQFLTDPTQAEAQWATYRAGLSGEIGDGPLPLLAADPVEAVVLTDLSKPLSQWTLGQLEAAVLRGMQEAVTELARRAQTGDLEAIRTLKDIAQNGFIATGMQKASVDALEQVARYAPDERTRLAAVRGLTGSQSTRTWTAIEALERVARYAPDQITRRAAVQALGTISRYNSRETERQEKALEALVALSCDTLDPAMRIEAIRDLAVAARSAHNPKIRDQALDYLTAVASVNLADVDTNEAARTLLRDLAQSAPDPQIKARAGERWGEIQARSGR